MGRIADITTRSRKVPAQRAEHLRAVGVQHGTDSNDEGRRSGLRWP